MGGENRITERSNGGDNMDKLRMTRAVWAVVLAVALAGCKGGKDNPVPPQPPVADGQQTPIQPNNPTTLTDRPSAPRIDSFTAEPARIDRGQSITLRWATTSADTATIDQGIGTVAPSGSRQLFPTATTTYVLIARNGVGSDTRTVTVEVGAAPAASKQPPTTTPEVGIAPLISQLQDIYFDYDMSELRDDSRRALNTDADLLKRIFAADARISFVIEGHADERGSAEYNLGLADRRAIITRDALTQLGVPGARLRTVSFGEEAPVCRESNEDCWQRNRRAHLGEVK
jgi:peptidoglycan-associated lipoprotein